MEFEKIIAISGHGSLFLVISRTNKGFIAESLEDKKRIPVFQSMGVTTLKDISVYTGSGEVALNEILVKIYEKEGGKESAENLDDNSKLFAYFESVVPDFDKERVYASHIKKMVKWYNQLVKNNLIDVEKLKSKDEVDAADESEGSAPPPAKQTKNSDEFVKVEEKKKELTKTAPKPSAARPVKSTGAIKNAPAKKVQTVRKAGGS